MAPAPVTVLILAPLPHPGAGPLVRLLGEARATLAGRTAAAFRGAGAARVLVRRDPPDDMPFGARLRGLVDELRPEGLVVLGGGSIPLATSADLAALLAAAAADRPGALANNAFSADVVAIACARAALRDLPPALDADNALPRWLAEVAGVPVRDLRERRHLAVDVDSPLDLLLIEDAILPGDDAAATVPMPSAEAAAPIRTRLAALRALARDPAAELLIAGRTSARDIGTVERGSRARTRVLIEERGLRTSTLADDRGRPNRRPPRSLLADLLEGDGPAALGELVARFADGALVDSRVLLAARLGADERGWPPGEDRCASDLLLADRVADPWLRDLTAAAADAPVPILLGGHTLVGPGAALVLGIAAGDR